MDSVTRGPTHNGCQCVISHYKIAPLSFYLKSTYQLIKQLYA